MNTTSRGAATRRRILEAAATLTIKSGVNGTSVDDVLKASGTGKSQFYHYFASKDALVKELIAHHLDNSLGLKAMAPDAGFTSIDELGCWLDRLIRAQADGLFDDGCPIGNLAAELAAQNEAVRLELQAVFQAWRDALTTAFESLKAKGALKTDADPPRLARFLIGSLEGAILLAKTERSPEPLVAACAELLSYVKSKAPQARQVLQGATKGADAKPAPGAGKRFPQARGHLTFVP